MTLNELKKESDSFPNTEKMPALFVGHGSPMNAIEENEFTEGWSNIASSIPKPKAILTISAHWETNGTFVTAMETPKTIHDFGGFPEKLYQVQYPAPGSPTLAREVISTVNKTKVLPDLIWGLDHGTWSVLKHFYPKADIPIVQLSLNYTQKPLAHYELAKELLTLRNKGVLIVGSGNIVHNLRMINWKRLNEIGFAYDWATIVNEKVKEKILAGDSNYLINYQINGDEFNLAVPTPEHYLPMLYILALKDNKDEVTFFNDKAVGGSLTMTSFKLE